MPKHLSPGKTLRNNCYCITHLIGQGGFGITYLAEETGYLKKSDFEDKLEYIAFTRPQKVVIKELYFPDICHRDNVTGLISVSNTEKKQEFENLVNKQLEEGRTLHALNHPNIVKTRGIFKENNTAYMIMDYVDGRGLDHILKVGGISYEKSLAYIRQILSAVIYIHDRKILHLDITPDNILIDNVTASAVLIDFGASLRYGNDSRVASTPSKLVTGFKKHYAPNEQQDIDNLKEFDATFDTYAVGATLYHLLTNNPPPLSSLVNSRRAELIPPSKLAQNNAVSEIVDGIILKALSADYNSRYKSALEMDAGFEREAKYRQQLEIIKTFLDQGKYTQALKTVQNAIAEYGSIVALKALLENCYEKIDLALIEKPIIVPDNLPDDRTIITKPIAEKILIPQSVDPKSVPNPPPIDTSEIKTDEIPEVITPEPFYNNEVLDMLPPPLPKKRYLLYGALGVLTVALLAVYILREVKSSRGNKYYQKALSVKDSAVWVRNMLVAANYGNDSAYKKLGDYYQGQTLKEDSAIHFYNLLAKDDDGYGEWQMGYSIGVGRGGLKRNDTTAVEYFKKAAAHGNSFAQNNLGNYYKLGFGGLPKDTVLAVKWYKISADQNNPWAQGYLGDMYSIGKGGLPKNDSLAMKWFKKAAGNGNAHAQSILATDYDKGLQGLPRDSVLAFQWYNKAANNGDANAQYILGLAYEYGYRGLSKNYQSADVYYTAAANNGNANAQFKLAWGYDKSLCGMLQSDESAVYWYKLAAQNGNANAQCNLGVDYYRGENKLPRDLEMALPLFKKAADQGYSDAQYYLGSMYEKGEGGLRIDKTKARQLYQKACDGGCKAGCEALKNL